MNRVKLISPDECDEWIVESGRIKHKTGRYFRILDIAGRPFIDQPECGILGWIRDRAGNFVYQMKFEPGNICGSMMTCSLQATQSNLDCVHGGRRQYLAEYFSYQRGILQSEQGSKYLFKKNLNDTVVIDTLDGFAYPAGCYLISRSGILNQLLTDFGMTTDGRSALVSGPWDWVGSRLKHEPVDEPVAPDKTSATVYTPIFSKDHHGLTWVSVETDTREIRRWSQPLLTGTSANAIELWITKEDVPLVALDLVDEPGLKHPMWGPSFIHPLPRNERGAVVDVWQCEEGGRFWKDVHLYQIVRRDKSAYSGKFWVTLGQLQTLCHTPMRTTNELRCATSILLAHLAS